MPENCWHEIYSLQNNTQLNLKLLKSNAVRIIKRKSIFLKSGEILIFFQNYNFGKKYFDSQ